MPSNVSPAPKAAEPRLKRSMGPWIVRRTGGRASIGRPADAAAVLAGRAATLVVPG